MAASKAAVLSKSEENISLRKQVAKVMKPPAKNVLFSPYTYAWPEVEAESAKKVMEKLTNLFKSLPIQKVKESWESKLLRKKQEKNKEYIEEKNEEDEERKKLRSQLAVGVMEITRCLEKDNLDLFLVCQSAEPAIITRHLIPLAASRQCPALCLPAFNATVGPLMGFSSVLGIGFKKVSKGESSVFSSFVRYAVNLSPKIKLSFLEDNEDFIEQDSTLKKHSSQKDKTIKDKSSDGKTIKHLPEESAKPEVSSGSSGLKDYSYLYVYKADKIKKRGMFGDSFISFSDGKKMLEIKDPPSPKTSLPGDCVPITSKSTLGFSRVLGLDVSEGQELTGIPKKGAKRKLSDEKADTDTFPSFRYKTVNIGTQLPNSKKKKRKKKAGKKNL